MRLSNEAGMRSQARHGALLVRISDPLSRTLHCVCVCVRGGAAVVQHVRVIPARLLNFGSHRVIVYGYFNVVKHKVVWQSAFSTFDKGELCECFCAGVGMGKSLKGKLKTRRQISHFITNKAARILLEFIATTSLTRKTEASC